ncbi:MAG: phosphotransferase [Deltaproteobacteria bacterium]|nr:phosphotransferase [Deltaproteobacteria bacterium]MBW2354573.1 phosphotransferase [Deltaproteobacteria bacterium]
MNAGLKKGILEVLRQRGETAEDLGFDRLKGDGSRRIFWRITVQGSGFSLIAMCNPPYDAAIRRENHAYLMIGRHLRQRGALLPRIFHFDLEGGWFIMEDMGRVSLQEFVSSGKDPLPVYERVVDHLFRMQIRGAAGFDPKWCCQTERYDRTVMLKQEAHYFRDAFLGRYLGLKGAWSGLEGAFSRLAEGASMADSAFFLHRDFQSRNIMLSGDRVGIIDWQGGRLGPLGYDLASLVIDPYPSLSRAQRVHVYRQYLDLIREHDPAWAGPFERCFPYLAIQRNLQILGAFSFLTVVMNKAHFEAYIPTALETLDDLLHLIEDDPLSPLRDLVRDLRRSEKILDMARQGG